MYINIFHSIATRALEICTIYSRVQEQKDVAKLLQFIKQHHPQAVKYIAHFNEITVTIVTEYSYLLLAHMLTIVYFENTSNAVERNFAEDVLSSFEYIQHYKSGYLSSKTSILVILRCHTVENSSTTVATSLEEEISLLRAEFSHLYI